MYLPFLIYALVDPRNGEIRYIGKSSIGMKRPARHAHPRGLKESNYKARWVRQLVAEGLSYHVRVLYQAPVKVGLDEAECFWIRELRERGCRLTNSTSGGDGGTRECSMQTRAKIAKALTGQKHDPDRIAKMAASKVGKKRPPFSDETRARMSKAAKGRVIKPDTRAKLSASLKGRNGSKRSDESKVRIAAAARAREARRREMRRLDPCS